MPTNHFKLLGSDDPVNQSLGVMTQGVGFPLRNVEPAVSGGDVTVLSVEVLRAESFLQQLPTGLGAELQVEFGALQSNAFFSLAADGALTCNATEEYDFRVTFSVGRRGAAGGTSQIYIRSLVDGVQLSSSLHAIIDNPDIEIPIITNFIADLTAGEVVTFEIIRDTDGNDSGGLEPGVPDVIGWNDAPSAQLVINRTLAVTP